jgi:SNF2 family DNA or RNA helicase
MELNKSLLIKQAIRKNNKKLISDYLTKPIDNWDWVKDLTDEEIQFRLDKYFKDFKFKYKPYKHQAASLIAGISNSNFLYFLDMGTGKSAIASWLIEYRKQLSKINKKCLILVPNVSLIGNWQRELTKQSNMSFIGLYGNEKEKLERLKNNTDICILNYQGLPTIVADRVGDGRKKKNVINDKKLINFISNFDAVIYDEIHSSGLSNRSTLTFKICANISRACKFRYGLTGTPFGRNPANLWSQFYLIDFGETLGKSVTFFRNVFFSITKNYWGGIDYTLKSSMEQVLHDKIKNKSLRYSEEEANTLPEKIFITKTVEFPKESQIYYDDAKKNMVAEVRAISNSTGKEYSILKNTFVNLRMLTSGYIRYKDEDDENSERIDIPFKENPKLDMLEELLLEMPDSSKAVIFFEYTASGKLIRERLKKLKIKHSYLAGSTKDKDGACKKFINDDKCKILVTNSKSGGVGLDLQVANYVIFFESPVSPIIRKQAEKRCHRTGQSKRVFFYDIIMENSIDEKIIQYIEQGKKLFSKIIEGHKDNEFSFNETSAIKSILEL